MSKKYGARLTKALLFLSLCFTFLLMSMAAPISKSRNSQMLPVRCKCSGQEAFASEKPKEERPNEAKSTTAEPKQEGKEGETKPAEEKASAEAETKPVKYSVWQDVFALIIAAVLIAAAYLFIKQLAAKQSK